MDSWVADYTRRIAPSALKAAGVVGVCRYMATHSSIGKIIGRAEYEELGEAGLDVVLNWEQAANDWLGGARSGHAHGAAAVAFVRAMGHPTGRPLPGSADFDMRLTEWNSSGRAYAVAYRDTVRDGGYVPGVYGAYDLLTWCRDLGGYGMFWQSMSTGWSGGRNKSLWPGVHLRQRFSAVTIAGQEVDKNDIHRSDWAMQREEVPDDMDAIQAQELKDVHFATTQIPDPANPGQRIPLQTAISRLLGATAIVSDAQIQVIADKLIASRANGLTPADHAGIVTDLRSVFADASEE
jgi:hypothetical protein